MTAIATALVLWSCIEPAESFDRPEGAPEVATLRRLSSEFDRAQRAAFEGRRRARTDKERAAAVEAAPDPRHYARQFLELAREAEDEGTVIDALVWVVRHAGDSPESDEAAREIVDRHLASDRIAGACWPLAARGEEGERLLRRIVAENPSPEVRGQACLGLGFASRMLLRNVQRLRLLPPERRPELVRAHGEDSIALLERTDPAALVRESEEWQGRALDEFPGAIRNPEVADFLPILSETSGPGAERVLRRVAEAHPNPETRREAVAALLLQQMRLAALVRDVRHAPPGGRLPLAVEDIPGGVARLRAIDPGALAREIDGRFRGLADHASEIPGQGIVVYHLLTALGSNSAFHEGAERLLRRVAEDHPAEGLRTVARRSLAFFLAGMAGESTRLRFAAGPDLASWVDFLGEERVGQLRGMDPARLDREAADLAERVAAERRDSGGPLDRDLESLRRALGLTAVGRAAPEIEGADLDGRPFRLSDYRGRVVLLDFWNHRSCPHCRATYPTLRTLAREFEGRPFALLGVDTGDDRDDLARLVEDGEVTWRFWFTHGATDDPTFVRWAIQGVPNLILLDHRGVIRVRYLGTPTLETLRGAVGALVAEAEVSAGPPE